MAMADTPRLVAMARLAAAAALAAGIACGTAGAQAPRDAPTAGQAAALFERQWRDAGRKFDGRRAALLRDVGRLENDGPYRADWESLQTHEAPSWYRDAKFGIFIHWGVYAVPAFASEWYPRAMYDAGSEAYKHHVATFGPPAKFGYKDFIPLFKAQRFDPRAWARLFKESGAKYVVPVFEHHDGFAMYDCSLSDWTAVKMGPHRDLAGDLAAAVRAEGLRLGASSHRIEHDWFMETGRRLASDVNDPKFADFYGPAHPRLNNPRPTPLSNDFTYLSDDFGDDWLARSAEIVEKYHPDLMYFDWWIGQPGLRHQLTRFAAFYYNESLRHGGSGVINYKDWSMQEKSAVLDIERGQLEETRPLPWQTDTSVSNQSWGYVEHDTYKPAGLIVQQLVDVVSKNGNLLLNIGPRADGVIPEEVGDILHAIGGWLRVNGDAIYGTRPWKLPGEGPTHVLGGTFNDAKAPDYTAQDFRFTTRGADLYAIEMAWPAGGEAVIRSLGSPGAARVTAVQLLGSDAVIDFDQTADGLHLHLPARAPGGFAYAFRIRLST